jgi:uncharacterized membrane protein
MNSYLVLKAFHIVSSTVLFGTGLGIAFFKWAVDRSGNVSAIWAVSEKVVLADWLFTTPAIGQEATLTEVPQFSRNRTFSRAA